MFIQFTNLGKRDKKSQNIPINLHSFFLVKSDFHSSDLRVRGWPALMSLLLANISPGEKRSAYKLE